MPPYHLTSIILNNPYLYFLSKQAQYQHPQSWNLVVGRSQLTALPHARSLGSHEPSPSLPHKVDSRNDGSHHQQRPQNYGHYPPHSQRLTLAPPLLQLIILPANQAQSIRRAVGTALHQLAATYALSLLQIVLIAGTARASSRVLAGRTGLGTEVALALEGVVGRQAGRTGRRTQTGEAKQVTGGATRVGRRVIGLLALLTGSVVLANRTVWQAGQTHRLERNSSAVEVEPWGAGSAVVGSVAVETARGTRLADRPADVEADDAAQTALASALLALLSAGLAAAITSSVEALHAHRALDLSRHSALLALGAVVSAEDALTVVADAAEPVVATQTGGSLALSAKVGTYVTAVFLQLVAEGASCTGAILDYEAVGRAGLTYSQREGVVLTAEETGLSGGALQTASHAGGTGIVGHQKETRLTVGAHVGLGKDRAPSRGGQDDADREEDCWQERGGHRILLCQLILLYKSRLYSNATMQTYGNVLTIEVIG